MSTQCQVVLDAALALPEPERMLLVERLLETLSSEPEDVTEEDFAAELDRRWAEFQQDPSTAAPWPEVRPED